MKEKGSKLKNRHKPGLIIQIYILLAFVMIILGVVTFLSQRRIARDGESADLQTFVERIADETISSIREYPSWQWLLRYCYEHADTMEIDYNSSLGRGSVTARKCSRFGSRHPKIQLRYASAVELEALGAEDQKLAAEILYSWIISRIDQIKQSYQASFLYCVVTDSDTDGHPYEDVFYLFSGADKGSVRGTGYGEVYPLGMTRSFADNPTIQEAMRNAVESARLVRSEDRRTPSFDKSGNYVDGYTFLGWIDTHPMLVGTSYNIKEIGREIHSRAKRGTIYALLYQILLLQTLMLFLFLYGIRPLKKVLQIIRNFTENKNSSEVRTSLEETLSGQKAAAIRHNEIGQLADDFIDLTEEMDEHVRRIEAVTAENERIEVELQLSAAIQSQMLPSQHPEFPESTDLDLYALMDPAKEVGGDFYDYFMVDDSHLALVIADVSGKGIPASLFMMIAKTLIKNRAKAGESPKEILRNVNNQLCEGNETGFFVTVWLAIIDLETGEGMAANAGHEHPMLARQGGSFEMITYRHSPAVALMEDISFKEHSFILHPGDRLFVYTDGVPEAINSHEEMFGTTRILETLNRDPDASPENLLHRLRQEVDAYSEGTVQFDDITMLCLWYKISAK